MNRWFFLLAGIVLLVLFYGQSVLLPLGQQALRPYFAPKLAAVLTETTVPNPIRFPPKTYDYTPPEYGFDRHDFTFAGQKRSFWMLPAPATSADGTLPAAVLLLHGSGRDGRSMLDMWRDIAVQGAVLIAPDALSPKGWNMQTDGADFQKAVLEQARAIAAYDPDKISLYGHSSGANMALALGSCTDLPVKAVAIHAGAFDGCTGWPRPIANRYLIQIGDSDETFPLPAVRASAEKIVAAGFPVELRIIQGHNHWYYDIGPILAVQAWRFFQG